MALLLFSNRATTTLAGPISAGATTINVAAGTGAQFPSPGAGQYFLLTLVDNATKLIFEVVQVTSRATDAMTVIRAQEETTARAWLAGDIASDYWTAGSAQAMVQVQQLQTQATNYAVDAGSANSPSVTLVPAPTSLGSLTGVPIRVKMNATNTGNTTLNVVGASSALVINPDGSALSANQLIGGNIYEFFYNGTAFELSSSSGYHPGFFRATTFVSTGSFTVPAGVYLLDVELWGAGGPGGSSTSVLNAGGGGGGGGYCRGLVATTPGTIWTVTIGVGVNSGTPVSTTFGGALTATGGSPGTNGSISAVGNGGAGGTGSGGYLNIQGASGNAAISYNANIIEGGMGGTAFCGPAPQRVAGGTGAAFNGNNGFFPGGGATGCTLTSGLGGNGMCVVRY
jgi:hypothetical protein